MQIFKLKRDVHCVLFSSIFFFVYSQLTYSFNGLLNSQIKKPNPTRNHNGTTNIIDESRSHLYWPQWRGPLGTGLSPHANPPTEWSESKNIRWKKALPGKGHSTPIIWSNHLFITSAVPFGEVFPPKFSTSHGAHDLSPITQQYKFIVISLNRKNGEKAWEKTLHQELPHEGIHYTASLASASPVTDGNLLYVYFGSRGLYCLDLSGQEKWRINLGKIRPMHAHGEGSSPALYEDTLIINWDHEGPSFLVAFNKTTGEQRWKTKRESFSSWTTPIAVNQNGKKQIIISGSQRIQSYCLDSGILLWECKGLSKENVVATPVAGHGMVFTGSTYDKTILLAIRLNGAKGDITGTKHIAWSRSRGAPYVPSPLLYGDALYFISQFQGVLTRVNAHTGKNEPGQFRLNGIKKVFASPIGAAGRVYIVDRNGSTIVLNNSKEPTLLSINTLDDSFSASPIAVGSELYLRGEKNIYCIIND